MADTFTLVGSFATQPTQGNPSAMALLNATLDERMQLQNKSVQSFDLTADPAVAVSFPSGFECNVLIVKTAGGKVRVRATSTDGSAQAIPVDGFLALITESVGITAIDLTREAGVEVVVEVFMGYMA